MIIYLTPQAQLSIQWTFFPFGLKWIPLLRRHVLIAIKTFSPKVKSINSSLIKNIYIFDISYHFLQSEQNKSEVWKGKNLCAWGVKIHKISSTNRQNYSSLYNLKFFLKNFDIAKFSITSYYQGQGTNSTVYETPLINW